MSQDNDVSISSLIPHPFSLLTGIPKKGSPMGNTLSRPSALRENKFGQP